MPEADELAIQAAKAAERAERARADREAEADRRMLQSIATLAREALDALKEAEYPHPHLLRLERVVRSPTRFRRGSYAYDQKAGWLLCQDSTFILDSHVDRYYWLVSDGRIAVSRQRAHTGVEARVVDVRSMFEARYDTRQTVRNIHAALANFKPPTAASRC